MRGADKAQRRADQDFYSVKYGFIRLSSNNEPSDVAVRFDEMRYEPSSGAAIHE
jgi:hypothetical protein